MEVDLGDLFGEEEESSDDEDYADWIRRYDDFREVFARWMRGVIVVVQNEMAVGVF